MSSKASCPLLLQSCHFICLLCRTNVLQHFGWNSYTYNRAGISSCELSACGKMWGRRLSLSPAAHQGCACVSPRSSEDVLSDRWHAAELRPVLSWQKLTILVMPVRPRATWCELWGTPVMQWRHARGSGHGSDALPDDTTLTEMLHVACRWSCGQV